MPKGTCQHCGKQFEADNWAILGALLAEHEAKCRLAPSTKKEEEEWEEKTPAFMSFEEAGDEIEGILTGLDVITLHDKQINRARVKTSEGVKSFLLTTTLEPLILDIDTGTTIKVRYEGEELTAAKRKVKKFRVWVKK